MSIEAKRKIGLYNTGKKRSVETCEKLRLKAIEREHKKRLNHES
jgi:hypothetical protein